MGMKEERLDWAAGLETHAKRMYGVTSNPYYVVAAIAAARTAKWKVPEWALEVLLAGVHEAWWEAQRSDAEVSLDKALGLQTKRGGSPARRRAIKASIESPAFSLIKTIHACFDVSIPEACELVFYAIAYDFARETEEVLSRPYNAEISDERLIKLGLSRDQHDAMAAHDHQRRQNIIESSSHSECVKAKLRGCAWWEVTWGDRVGYSLEQLIDRYYRDGTKRIVPHGNASEQLAMFYEGYSLLLMPDRCTTEFTISEAEGTYIAGKSSVAALPRRAEFLRFVEHMSVEKSLISGQ